MSAQELFAELQKALSPDSPSLTPFDRWMNRLWRLGSRWGAIALAVFVADLTLVMITGMRDAWMEAWLLILLMINAILWEILIALVVTVHWVAQKFVRRIRHVHDGYAFDQAASLAMKIAAYPEADVALVKLWIADEAKGMKRRVRYVFGGQAAGVIGLGVLKSKPLQDEFMHGANLVADHFHEGVGWVIGTLLVGIFC